MKHTIIKIPGTSFFVPFVGKLDSNMIQSQPHDAFFGWIALHRGEII